MGTDLELYKKAATQLGPTRRFQKKQIVTRELEKKEKLTVAQKLWVNNDVAAMFTSGGGIIAAIALPLGGVTWIPIVVFALALLVSFGVLVDRESHSRSTLSTPSHSDRVQIQLFERSRVNTPHAGRRKARPAELDNLYNHYSVNVNYSDTKITLLLLEHVPWKDGKYKAQAFDPSEDLAQKLLPERYKEYNEARDDWEKRRNEAKEKFERRGNRKRISGYITYEDDVIERFEFEQPPTWTGALSQRSFSLDEDDHVILQARDEMEELAAHLEEDSYNEAKQKLLAQRKALLIKRG